MTDTFDIIEEPSGSGYLELLRFCAAHSETFQLVIVERDWLDRSALDLLQALEPFRHSLTTSARWPGTVLSNTLATLHRFYVAPTALALLQTATDRLYHWQQPHLPEDPSFLRPNGEPILGTIAHERDAFLMLSPAEYDEVKREAPSLKLVRRDSAENSGRPCGTING